MAVGILTIELRMPGNSSLKEKRMVVKSLKDKIRQRFNVSIAEIDDHDKWQLATFGIAYIGTDKTHVDQALSKVVDFIKEYRQVDLINYNMELL
ncbi:MAG: hypothetical protein AMJ78_08645 [Omnitrophica WOR_2 bacterium SM23_29]|nr:MAG: hypothetical protein AMJ78_08645 [Omnitrophica WOR_2 bacterium SM23_29]